ncbi:MAG: hypothetical protein GY750_09195 [Lentisphaerae bacterium]|nr:hypothetical protein [Lentisphaerota bacterium]MCP4101587.1 hypothetical protein [Lentisphaerota bacterium]
MLAITSLLIVLFISLFITRIGSIVLMHTGVPVRTAKFQAHSAITGCGYTTSESEIILKHPVRRRAISTLMVLGHIGFIATMSTAVIGFVNPMDESHPLERLGLLAAGLFVLYIIAYSKWFERKLDKVLEHLINFFYTRDALKVFIPICHMNENYEVVQIIAEKNNSLIDKNIKDIDFKEKNLLLLGIQPVNADYETMPKTDKTLAENDTLFIYGHVSDIDALAEKLYHQGYCSTS